MVVDIAGSGLLGSETDTQDNWTNSSVIGTADWSHVNVNILDDSLEKFRGEIEQTPPMYSAKKLDGKKLYELARKGTTVERKPQIRHIYELKLVQDQTNLPQFTIDVTCSKGTYVRTLIADISKECNTLGHMTSLVRVTQGNFHLEECLNYNLNETIAYKNILNHLRNEI
eukprot:TRINITY_DN9434_c0_g1_i2.p1 TRINITY_DN9434_c0_g1~~TRINITY_DN9434_c0_g1_i2.p1  ORF type:complete len:170 (+),score=28.49 TRINITY_DN9434_c0_g1_i2:36-545(+)